MHRYSHLVVIDQGQFLQIPTNPKPQGGGADTLKFNMHIIGHAKKRAKKGCEFNQKRCEFKILLKKNP